MKFGVCLPNYGSHLSKEALIKSSKLAEKSGFDSLWTTDHIIVPKKHSDPYGNILDCLTTLAYLGAVTDKIHLGTSILVLPLRDPIVVAKQVATIDYLTNGRLILGTAIGWMEEEFQNLAVPFHGRGKRFEEAVRLIRTVNQTEYPQFEGRYHKFTDATFKPAAISKDGPPIWFGGNSEAALMRAARLADGWHPVGLTVERYHSMVQKVRPMLRGEKPFTFSLRIHVDLDGSTKPYPASSGESRDVITGTTRHATKAIERYQDAGLDHLVCYFGDIDVRTLERKITQFAEEIIPSFR